MKHHAFSFLLAAFFVAGPASADLTPVKISQVSRSIFFRNGSGTRGDAGFNSGRYSRDAFNGDFTDYMQQNTAGAELVIPTTDPTTGMAFYVTEFLVGHKGNTKYSLYYTTEAEPANILSNPKDPRNWLPIEGAIGIQAANKKTYGVNKVATAVKYVFDTTIEWTPSLGEVEVWVYDVDPDTLGCLHPSYTEWHAIAASSSCTEDGYDQRECTVCGFADTRRSTTIKALGHDYQSTLERTGSGLQFGSGTIECSRHDLEISCTNGPVDFVRFGGVKTDGVVQFMDLSVSSTENENYGQRPDYLIDGGWSMTWGTHWYPKTFSHDEWVEFDFGTAIDLTAVEFSVHNHDHVIQFYSYDGTSEQLIGEWEIVKDSSGGAPEFQRQTIEFRGVTLEKLRVRTEDSIGVGSNNYSGKRTPICEMHPWGTVNGAGKIAAVRTRIIID